MDMMNIMRKGREKVNSIHDVRYRGKSMMDMQESTLIVKGLEIARCTLVARQMRYAYLIAVSLASMPKGCLQQYLFEDHAKDRYNMKVMLVFMLRSTSLPPHPSYMNANDRSCSVLD